MCLFTNQYFTKQQYFTYIATIYFVKHLLQKHKMSFQIATLGNVDNAVCWTLLFSDLVWNLTTMYDGVRRGQVAAMATGSSVTLIN